MEYLNRYSDSKPIPKGTIQIPELKKKRDFEYEINILCVYYTIEAEKQNDSLAQK